MGINIKNPETQRLIRELAQLTGEGQTEAVTNAVAERLQRLGWQRERGGRMAEALLAIGKETAPRLKGLPEIGEYLYDPETGLPR